jgi:hypothetical protein
MQHQTLSNGEKDRLQLNKAGPELPLQLDSATARPTPEDVAQLAPRESTGTVGGRPKTMGASGPGSEYWLP